MNNQKYLFNQNSKYIVNSQGEVLSWALSSPKMRLSKSSSEKFKVYINIYNLLYNEMGIMATHERNKPRKDKS